MDAIDARLHEMGYATLWRWLEDHPDLNWVEIGRELGFVPIAVMKKCAREAPSVTAAVRQSLLRNLRRYFGAGWDPDATFQKAQMAGALFSEFSEISVETRDALLDRLSSMPRGWRPVGPEDPDLVGITADLFEEKSS